MNPKDWVGRAGRWVIYAPQTTRILLVCSAFLGGMLVSPVWQISTAFFLFVALIVGILLVHDPRLVLLGLVGAGFWLGYIRGYNVGNQLSYWESVVNEQVVLVVEAKVDSSVGYRGQLEFDAGNLHTISGGKLVPKRGVLKVQGYGVAAIRRGDVVKVSGRMRDAWGNRDGQVSFSQLEIVANKQSLTDGLRRKFFATTYTAIPDPHASLGLGFLVGVKTVLPESLLDQLGRTGLTHIVAVSGYNLTIIVRAIRRSLGKKSKFISVAMSFALIFAFLGVTGISPSIFRASVVSSLALAAWYYGRTVKPTILLMLSAAFTAGLEPTYLWRDIGWYLSFLAFYGVLVLAPLITRRIFVDRAPHWLVQIVIETISAQLLVLPLIAVIFGDVSVISLVANALILPLTPLAMLLTFVAGAVGMLIPTLIGWFALPATYLLGLIIFVVKILASLSWSSISVSLNWGHGSILYVAVAILLLTLRLKVGKVSDYSIVD